jgi:hypothetical protein
MDELDKYYAPCGPCMFCGHEDKRHRVWDTFIALAKGGETAQAIAFQYNEPVKYIELVLKLQPYQ